MAWGSTGLVCLWHVSLVRITAVAYAYGDRAIAIELACIVWVLITEGYCIVIKIFYNRRLSVRTIGTPIGYAQDWYRTGKYREIIIFCFRGLLKSAIAIAYGQLPVHQPLVLLSLQFPFPAIFIFYFPELQFLWN
jgi:hypothetical protein